MILVSDPVFCVHHLSDCDEPVAQIDMAAMKVLGAVPRCQARHPAVSRGDAVENSLGWQQQL